MRIECSAVLFDLDGVLVDSTAYIERQWREWAAGRGLDPAPFLRVCHGRRALETIRLAAPRLNAEAEVARFREQVVESDPVLDAVPGAAALVRSLPPGTWAVVTSGSATSARRRLCAAGLPLPAVLVSADDVRHGKPSPEGYLRAAERLGVPASACVVIEDAPPGVEAARAGGMVVIALVGTYSPDQLAAADYRIDSLEALGVLTCVSASIVRAAPPRIALTSS
ncbi:MAG TPA: HAD-IA family hydrolase [Gemmatimonadales bacterium]|nr:HAD-IA family hydrolase [Gemmatimonadales bacterium]